MWVRGLKHRESLWFILPMEVAPYVGAWIETFFKCNPSILDTSHPMWVRGLKLLLLAGVRMLSMSHPMWVRGLKHRIKGNQRERENVAPYVGAWIEAKRN